MQDFVYLTCSNNNRNNSNNNTLYSLSMQLQHAQHHVRAETRNSISFTDLGLLAGAISGKICCTVLRLSWQRLAKFEQGLQQVQQQQQLTWHNLQCRKKYTLEANVWIIINRPKWEFSRRRGRGSLPANGVAQEARLKATIYERYPRELRFCQQDLQQVLAQT